MSSLKSIKGISYAVGVGMKCEECANCKYFMAYDPYGGDCELRTEWVQDHDWCVNYTAKEESDEN